MSRDPPRGLPLGGSRLSVLRTSWIFCVLAGTGALICVVLVLFAGRHRSAGFQLVGTLLTRVLERLGPAFVKIGQVLSTRHDLLPSELLAPLGRLQDRVRPMSGASARRAVERHLSCPIADVFGEFDEVPLASGSIAQVHLATLKGSNQRLAVKLKRPRIDRVIAHDARVFLLAVRCVTCLPAMRSMPLAAAMQSICEALVLQTDFEAEAKAHQCFYETFAAEVRIPRLFPALCTKQYLVMEFIPGMVKLADPTLSADTSRQAVAAGLRVLYEMIFCTGLIHCDLHPGNLQCTDSGKLALVDFGFWAQLPDLDRQAFSEFFLSVALGDSRTAAKIVRANALSLSERFDAQAFEIDMMELIARSSRQRSGEFLVSEFVLALFKIQRSHGIFGSPAFTMAITSLLVFEGIARPLHPELDFQREAMPFLLRALG